MGSDSLRSRIRAFRYHDDEQDAADQLTESLRVDSPFLLAKTGPKSPHKVHKPSSSTKRRSTATVSKSRQKAPTPAPRALPDLPPCLTTEQQVLFVGYNPGVESSLQQHHYAHFTNLFWKLFNQSQLFTKVLQRIQYDLKDPLLEEPSIRPHHDNDLIRFKIGFTDLVLRCTKTAQELSMAEKLANVPRLFQEFQFTQSRYLVFIGKGIWEIIVKYLATKLAIKVKLTKGNFAWGEQKIRDGTGEDVRLYNYMLKAARKEIPEITRIYVFPNTSGLVASLSFGEKLALWVDLVEQI
ncbi:DNA glycosylase [Suhomyces tanzawaensis NRRL Y-17324]|uniref:DNA glycosylase n=1 Tax=Suhomyces tanzawaensis NRRL Y-17324 TaxID=984487 RepID=A0A1E4SII3_9ASCO|nr:DNA glycosylase [Suhomyces tanzawaensis NRRL Y-17324]ODV79316.1 DNA glycosylase [Suhomyces tanzawaensis NRRL Y-17324]